MARFSSIKRFQPWAALAAAAVLAQLGCVRAPLLPKAQDGLTAPYGEPRMVDRATVETQRNATRIYRIGPDDTLRVEVPDDPTLTQVYTVTAEGYILMPYLGKVKVENLTVDEVEAQLNKTLSDIIKDPRSKVGVQDYRSKFITVVGQVGSPGRIPMHADMLSLQEAVFAAGLITNQAAPKRTRIISPDPEKPVVRQVDLADVIYKGITSENVLLRPNDIVYVPAKYNMNVGAALREFIQPFDDYYTTRYKLDFKKRDQDQQSFYNNLFAR